MNYRRSQMIGGTFFFTLVTYQRANIFADIKNVNLLRDVIHKVKQRYPFKMHAYVLLPDHFHCIWTLPELDNDFSTRWRLIKNYFTRGYEAIDKLPPADSSRKNKQEQCIWQRRFWEHTILTESDFKKSINYIHYNPVKHGYAISPVDWPNSSIHYYIRRKIYSQNWGQSGVVDMPDIRE